MEGEYSQHAKTARSAATVVAAAFATVFGVLVPELAIVALVAAADPLVAFAVLFVSCTAFGWLVCFAFDAQTGSQAPRAVLARARAWIERNRAAVERRSAKLATLSEAAAFLVLSVTAGPLLTAIALKVRGGDARVHLRLTAASSALFSAVWVAVYAGGLAALTAALRGS